MHTKTPETSGISSARKKLGNPQGQPDFRINVKVVEATPIPDTWALITGDILANLRAALDHAVFLHVQATKPDLDPRHIQYPIDDTEPKFQKRATWFAEGVRQVIEDSQPYKVNDPSRHPLRMLRELVNMDKHRDLVIANYSIDNFVVPPQDDLYHVVSTKVYKKEMAPGAVVARAHLRLVQRVQGSSCSRCLRTSITGRTSKYPAARIRSVC